MRRYRAIGVIAPSAVWIDEFHRSRSFIASISILAVNAIGAEKIVWIHDDGNCGNTKQGICHKCTVKGVPGDMRIHSIVARSGVLPATPIPIGRITDRWIDPRDYVTREDVTFGIYIRRHVGRAKRHGTKACCIADDQRYCSGSATATIGGSRGCAVDGIVDHGIGRGCDSDGYVRHEEAAIYAELRVRSRGQLIGV